MKKKIAVMPINPAFDVIALYANSPFIDGKLTNFLSYRSYIWTKLIMIDVVCSNVL